MPEEGQSTTAILPRVTYREALREQRFGDIWKQDLDEVFAELAPRYDLGNRIATLGLSPWLRRRFIRTIEPAPGQRVLDVCAGTNVVGIDLLSLEPELEVHAIDRSSHMQKIGRQKAAEMGFDIESTIGDVSTLPYPGEYFDIVTLQFASRHLRIDEVFSEILRVLKPGGWFHHSDILRPSNPVTKRLYFMYLRACLAFTSVLVRSGEVAHRCKPYFIEALDAFYSPEELSVVLGQLGFTDISGERILFGAMAFHRARKPL